MQPNKAHQLPASASHQHLHNANRQRETEALQFSTKPNPFPAELPSDKPLPLWVTQQAAPAKAAFRFRFRTPDSRGHYRPFHSPRLHLCAEAQPGVRRRHGLRVQWERTHCFSLGDGWTRRVGCPRGLLWTQARPCCEAKEVVFAQHEALRLLTRRPCLCVLPSGPVFLVQIPPTVPDPSLRPEAHLGVPTTLSRVSVFCLSESF